MHKKSLILDTDSVTFLSVNGMDVSKENMPAVKDIRKVEISFEHDNSLECFDSVYWLDIEFLIKGRNVVSKSDSKYRAVTKNAIPEQHCHWLYHYIRQQIDKDQIFEVKEVGSVTIEQGVIDIPHKTKVGWSGVAPGPLKAEITFNYFEGRFTHLSNLVRYKGIYFVTTKCNSNKTFWTAVNAEPLTYVQQVELHEEIRQLNKERITIDKRYIKPPTITNAPQYRPATLYSLHMVALCTLVMDGKISRDSFDHCIKESLIYPYKTLPVVDERYKVTLELFNSLCDVPLSYLLGLDEVATGNTKAGNAEYIEYVNALKAAYLDAARASTAEG